MPVAEVVDARVEGGGDRGGGGTGSAAVPPGGTQLGGATTGGGEPDASRDTGAGESDASTEPRPDLSAFDGYWYVDGFGPRLDGAVGAYAAGMRVERNRAKMLTYEDEAVTLETSLVPATDRYGTWLLTNPVTGVVYRGAVAPTSGFAVFVADDDASGDAATVLIMARADDDVPAAPPDTLAYVRIGRVPAEGDGEIGMLRKIREDAYMREARYPAPPVNFLPDHEVSFSNIDPWRYRLYDSATSAETELVATSSGAGVIGFERTPTEDGAALVLGWMRRAPAELPRVGNLFCGGLKWAPEDGIQGLALPATLSVDGTLRWAGGLSQQMTNVNGFFELGGGVNPFGLDDSSAVSDVDDEVLIILPLDPGPDSAHGVWGMMACVRTDLVPFPL